MFRTILTRLVLILLLSISGIALQAQTTTFQLKPELAEGEWKDFIYLKDISLNWADSAGVRQALAESIARMRGQGHLIASVDGQVWRDSQLIAQITPGPLFRWAEIDDSNIDPFYTDKANLNFGKLSNDVLRPAELISLEEKILKVAINNGYPFAEIFLDSIELKGDRVLGKLILKKGPHMTFGEIRLISPVNVSKAYLQLYLGIPVGSLYSRDKINEIPNRLKELPFVQSTQNPTVSFIGKKAIINLFLKTRKASRGDAVLGFLPRNNSQNPEVREKPLFTVSGTLDLNNQLGLGERIFANFEQLQPQRQEIEFKVNYPYAFGLPFGVNGEFALYRRDSAYVDNNSELGLQYLFDANNYLKVFWENRNTNLTKIDTTNIILRKKLPDQLDTRNSLFGIEWQQQKLNYRFNPRSGWAVKLRTGFGFKNIKENLNILELDREDFDPGLLYDSLSQQSYQIRMEGLLENYLPLGQSATLLTRVKSGTILAEQSIFANEQYRIGGNSIMRGFDEESFNATTYVVATLEGRLLIDQNGALFLFADVGYVENVTNNLSIYDLPIGLGAGVNLETKVGIFGFSLAVGRQREIPFDLRKVKTHFGYVSLF